MTLNNVFPVISIIVPVYKVETFITSCLISIQKQTFLNWECLLIDDGSPDNSGEICEEFARNDSRFKVFHKENGGASSARNRGLEFAQGEWICFIDADDCVEDTYISDLVEHSFETDIVISGFKFKTVDVITNYCHKRNIYSLDRDADSFFGNFRFKGMGGPYCKLYKKEIIKKGISFCEEMIFGEDLDFFLQYLLHCKILKVTDSANYIYINHEGSVSSRINSFHAELIGLQRIVKDWEDLYSQFSPSKDYQQKEYYNMVLLRRVLCAIYSSGLNRLQRLSCLKSIDGKFLNLYSNNVSKTTFREMIVQKMFGRRMYIGVDVFLMICIFISRCKKALFQ